MPKPIRFDRKMSEAEALMWRLDQDPVLSSTFANITVLDRPLDFERFCRRLERASNVAARLRHRVQAVPGGVAPPTWVADPDFDLRHHVQRVTVPAPGTRRELARLALDIAAEPFDRARPLWRFVVVDGLADGLGAVIQKLHHTLTDGEGGLRLSLEFLDVQRDAPEPPPIEPDPEAPRAPSAGPFTALLDLVEASWRWPMAMTAATTELLADPGRVPQAVAGAGRAARALVSQLAETQNAHSPLWTERSLSRQLELLRIPLEPVKAAAAELGGSLNTAFLTAAAEAAGAYHRRLGAPVETLRASMAISTRTRTSGANAFTLARIEVPTGEMSLAERFEAVAKAADAAREGSNAANLDLLAGVAGMLPTPLVTRLARQQARTIDFATSNVRGAPFPVYMAGAEVLENYPIGPLAGVAFNLTLLSYKGSLDLGLHLDRAAVAEPGLLRDLVEDAFAQLAALGASTG